MSDIWTYMFDNEYKQRADIERLNRLASQSRSVLKRRTRDLNARVEELEQEVGELALLCRGLLAVLREQGTLEDEALEAAMHRIDAADGVIDGRVTPENERPGAKQRARAKLAEKAPRKRRHR